MRKTRAVYLPLAKLEECALCHSVPASPLKLCAACGERAYCSQKCQKEDWTKHKPKCGKTDRINLERFYPFLACLAQTLHVHNDKPPHPGLSHTILNAPNPGCHPVGFPDGSAAKLVVLGDPVQMPNDFGSHKWWPHAMSPNVRGKMFRRISREGYVLPAVMSVCLALLSEMYTTTAVSAADSPDGKPQIRTRLTYKSSPIADFGIAAGSADVKSQDKLAYWQPGAEAEDTDASFFRGQDPNDHYWIYFTTIRGEDVLLDCSMFTFNMCLMVHAEPYLFSRMPPLDFAPAFFRERQTSSSTPDLYVERKRVSVLRDTDLHRAVPLPPMALVDPNNMGDSAKLVFQFMSKLADRPLSDTEMDLTFKCSYLNAVYLGETLLKRGWERFPAEPPLAIEKDPDERIYDGSEDDEAWQKHIRKIKKNKDNKEALRAAFEKWEAREKNKNKKTGLE
ncbi:hypothetical protein B0H19DRAFT_1115429 [Mycena capillaripes]|nr:hypothetical protein B0H19DRAFT_1115429 [Mycena capillaripes]